MHVVLLSCGHNKEFRTEPTPTQVVLCIRCNAPAEIPPMIPAQWSVKCEDCSYGGQFGAGVLSARVKATSHRLRLHHSVWLRNSEGWAELLTNGSDGQLTLFEP